MKYLLVFLCIPFTLTAEYYGQLGHDKFLNEEVFHGKRNGVFVDIGAFDGRTHSNSYFFEKELGWIGVCIEPMAPAFKKLRSCRHCLCLNCCVAPEAGMVKFIAVQGEPQMLSGIADSYHPEHFKRMKSECERDGGSFEVLDVPACTFNEIAQQNDLRHIDLLSIDTEGSEFAILKTIDFERCRIDVIVVENNFQNPDLQRFLEGKGFVLKTKLGWGTIPQDEIYVHKRLKGEK